ncbi:ABC transporter ATP-binding protein [Lachnotalea sp. AF33-28]|uniref:ABC transporter ATP-binding protein n=1 Tax=Lachnotalea sp. AF33-28 TaxID=2292046 RepID=UPI000E51AEE6|nr:ABC transporter ATP-binding protein [Lachnotalea sp. AF33-28]RHP32847.1 ABC transporter ATP-binding protein [Lachnotalea sp. AF33-28]
MNEQETLLSIKNLKTYFVNEDQVLKAVDDVSFDVKRGETLGIVGESGCGKSISCMSILKLVQSPNVRYEGGEILFEGKNTLKMTEKELRKLRGKEISVIFQEPMTALNPLYTVGDQMMEALKIHKKLSTKNAREKCVEYLEKVKIPMPKEMLNRYPFSLSGGMRQRVMIAMALITNPKLIIADEPTTALDVTIQAQILDLMNALKDVTGSSCIFITHDLGVISEMADRVVVMYGGKVCEVADTDVLFEHAMHPYTQGLIHSRPTSDYDGDRLQVIPGNVPSLNDKPAGCPFHPRCPYASKQCGEAFPPERVYPDGHRVSCWKYCNASEVQ